MSPEYENKSYIIHWEEQEILAIEERDGRLRPKYEPLLWSEAKANVTMKTKFFSDSMEPICLLNTSSPVYIITTDFS
jgi:hypothetical protein